jgi:hypothetical protein
MATAPGWYDDGHGALRWWDGSQWTEHVAQPDPEPAEAGDAPTEAQILAAAEAESVPAHVGAPGSTPGAGAEPAVAPPGHPVADPAAALGFDEGTDAAPGAFSAATAPRRSKLWIVWVVLGVVLLGIVIAVAVLVPLLFLGLASGSGGVQPDGADQQAAVAAIELYDDAWQDADCDAYMASTTEQYRAAQGAPDCDAFVQSATEFSVGVEDYEVVVTKITQEDDAIIVSTTESYDALLDDDGAPLDEPTPDSVDYVYTVVPSGDSWAIDALK